MSVDPKRTDRIVRPTVLGAVALILLASGCAEEPKSFTPALVSAEEAVRRGLNAWKEGKPAGEVIGQPKIYVTDTGRKPGQVLKSYQILGETRGPTGRTIAVTLQMSNPEEETKARYIVVGIDPLWVWRQEDYELLMHWEHRMPDPKIAEDKKQQAQKQEETKLVEEKASDIGAEKPEEGPTDR